jgi:L,D-peptidoglycan transpeptidase YkuD (ErfK/YbiS/YcfS/YnhG family)
MRLAVLVLLIALLPGAPARAVTTETVVLDGVTVRLWPGSQQVVTVRHTRGWHARLTFWRFEEGHWLRRFQASGRTGYGGLAAAAERVQGSGTTPLGSFRLLGTFGTHASPGTRMFYRRVGPGDFWVQDNASPYYNRWRNRADGRFRWWLPASNVNSSERLSNYPVQYEYAVTTSFNQAQVRYRGAGIFLHVDGPGATAGCVSGPRWFLRAVFRRLDPRLVPVIGIGR